VSQTPPNNITAEENVIGSVLVNPKAYIELVQFIAPDDFYLVRHRWIWTAFNNLQDRRVPIDYVTVCSELKSMKLLDDAGGDAYLSWLIEKTSNTSNVVHYGRLVETCSIRRKLIYAAGAIATEAQGNTASPVEEVVANCVSQLQVASASGRKKRKSIPQLLSEHRSIIEERSKSETSSIGILFNLPDLDKLLGSGLQKRFMLLAGRPGVGKTSLAIQGALEAVKLGKTVVIFSLEMDESQIVNILLSMLSKINSQALAIGMLSPEEWKAYDKAASELEAMKNRLIIDADPVASIQTMRAKCLEIKSVGPLDLVIIDYLMKIKGYSTLEPNDRANLLTLEIASLRAELDVALILVHHMNRAIEHRADGEPVLSDLNEGGERDPDIVAFLYKAKDVLQSGSMVPIRLTLVKHRHGPTWPPVELLFEGACTTFHSAIIRKL
jgi:replicative DNA helicase